MAVDEVDPVTGRKTTGHEWNGIKELDTPVPLGVLIFLVGPHWLFPNDNDVERNWAWWQQLVGNAYVWFGLAVVVALAVARRPKPAVV